MRLVNQVVTVGLAGWLLLADSWFNVQAPTLAPGQTAGLERALNLGLRISFFWIVVITLVSLVRHDVPRLRRLARAPAGGIPRPAA